MSETLLERFTKQILTEAKERANRLGISDVRIHALEGDAAEMIIDIVKREQVDLLVSGGAEVGTSLPCPLAAWRKSSRASVPAASWWFRECMRRH